MNFLAPELDDLGCEYIILKMLKIRSIWNDMEEKEYFSKFPMILRDALLNGKVKFPNELKKEYCDIKSYRIVTLKDDKGEINKSDFLSHMERKMKEPYIPLRIDDNNIEYYACSFFKTIDALKDRFKYPRKNKAIAKGTLKQEFGPIWENNEEHINLFLFEGCDPSESFEVCENEE